MGHEIGHVTARHSASQMSEQQLAMGGLIVGMAVAPELQRLGGLAQQGLGLLFLKFGRDDENQADELGLRYMTRERYDPREMLAVFGVLDGVTRAEGGGFQPKRLELVTLDRQMALPDFARAYPSTVELGTIGLINGVGANQMLPGGVPAKRVVGGRLPE
jgi:hypothetical protein